VLDYLGANEPVDDISLLELCPQRSIDGLLEPADRDAITPLRTAQR